MSNVNFRKTAKGYTADYQRRDGFGLERRYYRRADVIERAEHYGWDSPDQDVPGEGWTIAESLIVGGAVRPYRIAEI